MCRFKSSFLFFLLGMILLSGYASKVSAQLYSVEIILDKILCEKAVEIWPDTQDDIFGFIRIQSMVLNDSSGVKKRIGFFDGSPSFYNSLGYNQLPLVKELWYKSKSKPLLLATGQSVSSGASFLYDSLSLSRLLSIEFLIGGEIYDKELIPTKYQPCSTCAFNSASNGIGSSNYRLMKLINYQSQIESMATGTSKFLTIGNDQFFQLDFFETDPSSAHVKFLLKIKVTKK